MPPMDALGGPMGQPPMGQDPNMINGGMGMENGPEDMEDMDGGFDAGVDADPVEDPKKYIQQLSGKLSQELRKYNNEAEQPDEELNKYVAGMIIPQATKGLTDKGKREIIGKLKKGSVENEPMDNEGDEQPQETPNSQEMPMESRSYRDTITEIMNQIIFDDEPKQKKRKEETVNKKIKSKNPFVANR